MDILCRAALWFNATAIPSNPSSPPSTRPKEIIIFNNFFFWLGLKIESFRLKVYNVFPLTFHNGQSESIDLLFSIPSIYYVHVFLFIG